MRFKIAVAIATLFMAFNASADNNKFSFKQLPDSSPLRMSLFEKVGEEKNLDPRLLFAVALTESKQMAEVIGGKKFVKPDQFVLRAPDKIYRGGDHADSCNKLNEYLPRYKNVVDVGMMQVNVRWHGHRVSHACELLDAEKNLQVASDILLEVIKANTKKPLKTRIGNYHNPKDSLANRYGDSVIKTAQNLIDKGY